MRYSVDIEGLRAYLEQFSYKDFKDGKVLKEAHTKREIDYFNIDVSDFKESQIIKQGEPFLVDLLGNDLSIAIAMNRRFKNPKGRLVYAKFHETVSEDCRKTFGSCLNGYWAIPEQFINKDSK